MRTATGQFARSYQSMEDLFRFVEGFVRPLPGNEAICAVMTFVAEELFTNTVKYNPGGPDTVTVILTETDTAIILAMEDHQEKPFDITALEAVEVDLPLEQRRPGGLGIHLIKSMVDGVTYSFDHGLSRTTVVKNLEKKHV